MPEIWVIDNYDSFTYNLVQYLGQCGARVRVMRNDQVTLGDVVAGSAEGILLSPGPCTPRESGVCLDLARVALEPNSPLGVRPVFGVCLGHQAIGEVSGATVGRAGRVVHGKTSPVEHDGSRLFRSMPNPFQAVRYHSLSIRRETLAPGFRITASSQDDGEIMGIEHESKPIAGVQFHPESVLTENGLQIIRNFVDWVMESRTEPALGSR
ncbi:MAG TPA: aminodeoxychorismate/anthranilate synthase component II [Fimbriimonadaceae bacterium]|nr:aminodeoxychorismate/anthranilate synthase component II [Fimbriimonadaceae bacterium]HRJ32699.1 aminodeoxychorismate/anthranilate synthase component II [Fimbriimonadaceae bacterium]